VACEGPAEEGGEIIALLFAQDPGDALVRGLGGGFRLPEQFIPSACQINQERAAGGAVDGQEPALLKRRQDYRQR
jgi:hypothetical protein